MYICDCHNDFLTSITSQKEREKYFIEIVQSGVRNIGCAVYTTNSGIDIDQVKGYAGELSNLSEKYKINAMLSIEDIGFINSEMDLCKIIKLRPFSINLTWNHANQFGGGAHSVQGLSNLGRKYIKIFEQNHILIDTAHLSRKAFWDLCQITRKPIYNSHSNIYSIRRHNRNLTDQQIKKIVQSNGFLGITLYDEFISDKKISSNEIAMQFDYLLKNFGCKNFGLGTDFYGVENNHLPTDITGYNELENLFSALKKLGYSDKVIEGILFNNFTEFLTRVGI